MVKGNSRIERTSSVHRGSGCQWQTEYLVVLKDEAVEIAARHQPVSHAVEVQMIDAHVLVVIPVEKDRDERWVGLDRSAASDPNVAHRRRSKILDVRAGSSRKSKPRDV